MKGLLFSLGLFFLLISCGSKGPEKGTELALPQSVPEKIEEPPFPALMPGEVEFPDDVFGDIIELSGTSHPVDQLFKVKETQLLAKENMLLIKNRNDDNCFIAFSLPEFMHIKSFGRIGKGPGELSGPSIIQTFQPEHLFSTFNANGRIYHVNRSFELIDSKISLDTKRQLYDQNKICAASADEYYYVGVAPVAKEIYKYSAKDSIPETSVKQLSVKGFKGWASYTGYLGANFDKDRLVFAYKYFKKIVFTDLSGNVVRTINFDTNANTEKQSNVSILGPSSVTYYWGMSAQKDYVYLLYSGRTPLLVTEELREGSGYIFVEQFDWNGNPIRKFRLDRWGYFCVDDKEEFIFLASTTDEHPLYSFKLPE
jgi:hypothetical protein